MIRFSFQHGVEISSASAPGLAARGPLQGRSGRRQGRPDLDRKPNRLSDCFAKPSAVASPAISQSAEASSGRSRSLRRKMISAVSRSSLERARRPREFGIGSGHDVRSRCRAGSPNSFALPSAPPMRDRHRHSADRRGAIRRSLAMASCRVFGGRARLSPGVEGSFDNRNLQFGERLARRPQQQQPASRARPAQRLSPIGPGGSSLRNQPVTAIRSACT